MRAYNSICNVVLALTVIGIYNSANAEFFPNVQTNSIVTENVNMKQSTDIVNDTSPVNNQPVTSTDPYVKVWVLTDEEKAAFNKEMEGRKQETKERVETVDKYVNEIKDNKDVMGALFERLNKILESLDWNSKGDMGFIDLSEIVKKCNVAELFDKSFEIPFRVIAYAIVNCKNGKKEKLEIDPENGSRIKLQDGSKIAVCMSGRENCSVYAYDISKVI